jgi:hypothetical protein
MQPDNSQMKALQSTSSGSEQFMRKLLLPIWPLLLLVAFASTVAAHQVVLKNGSVIQFEKYRVENGHLIYSNADGKDVSISLADVDLERTKQLSVNENPPLQLPGLSSQTAASSNAVPSLADIARQVRSKDATPTSQRVFTNDDVSHSSSAASTPTNANPADLQSRIRSVQSLLDAEADKTARQLGEIDMISLWACASYACEGHPFSGPCRGVIGGRYLPFDPERSTACEVCDCLFLRAPRNRLSACRVRAA